MAQSDQSVARRALKAIDRLQARIADLERAAREPIAIVGMACRFPGMQTPQTRSGTFSIPGMTR